MKQALARIAAVAAASTVTAVALFGVGRLILFGDLGIATPTLPQPSVTAASANPASDRAVLSDVATPLPSPSETATPTASPSPSPTSAPLGMTPFRSGGRSYVGIVVPGVGTSFVAPFAGTVEVRVYQLIDGEVRVGSNVPSLPFFPYVSVVSPDKKMTYRPGTLGSVTEVIAKDGAAVAAGDPLFRLVAPGRSSWTTFYNPSASYDVVVSLQSVPGGNDLDPAAYLPSG